MYPMPLTLAAHERTRPVTEPHGASSTALQPIETCTATARTGKRCQKRPEPGQRVCRMHGGATPAAQAKAAERLLTARVASELAQRGWDPITDPLTAYADLVGEVWAFKELCREQLNQLEQWDVALGPFVASPDEDGLSEFRATAEQVRALVSLYERALDRARGSLVDMMRLGLDAQALKQAKERPSREQAEAFQRVLEQLLSGLVLSADQRAAVPGLLQATLSKEGLL